MAHRFSHAHVLYRNDNVKLFNLLEDATCGTKWANMIKPFAQTQDGQGSWEALLSNHAWSDKWDNMIEAAETYIKTKKWDGSEATTREMHIECYKGAYIEMEAAADHVPHEVAGQYIYIKRLSVFIDGYKDPGMQAVISTINNHISNLHDDWTGTWIILLPACPIAKWMNKKRNNTQILGIVDGILHQGASETGAEYHYHKPDE